MHGRCPWGAWTAGGFDERQVEVPLLTGNGEVLAAFRRPGERSRVAAQQSQDERTKDYSMAAWRPSECGRPGRQARRAGAVAGRTGRPSGHPASRGALPVNGRARAERLRGPAIRRAFLAGQGTPANALASVLNRTSYSWVVQLVGSTLATCSATRTAHFRGARRRLFEEDSTPGVRRDGGRAPIGRSPKV